MESGKLVFLEGAGLSLESVQKISRDLTFKVFLSESAKAKAQSCRNFLEKILSENRIVYGVNTGTGPNVRHIVPKAEVDRLQTNIVRMLACGLGKPMPIAIVRAAMAIRANSLAKGHSGVRAQVFEQILQFLNKGITPVVYEQGSVGASGDLVPLAHIASALMGEGEVIFEGSTSKTPDVLGRLHIEPLHLTAKEGLALVNGTSFMAAIGAVATVETEEMVFLAEATSVFALEMMRGNLEAFDPRIQDLRPYAGQAITARNILRMIEDSGQSFDSEELRLSLEKERDSGEDTQGVLSKDLQDPYTLRCIPQILGAVRDMLAFIHSIVEVDINSASDNPLVFAEEKTLLHGGNFQGYHVSMAMDLLSLSLNQLGILLERRLARYVDPTYSRGLSPYLTLGRPGLNNGMMGVQIAATSIVAENRIFATPASIQSISTNGNNQDMVSMGALAARKNLPLVENVRKLLAIEMFALCQAAEQRGVERLSTCSRTIYQAVRQISPPLREDRPLSGEINAIAGMLQGGGLYRDLHSLVRSEEESETCSK